MVSTRNHEMWLFETNFGPSQKYLYNQISVRNIQRSTEQRYFVFAYARVCLCNENWPLAVPDQGLLSPLIFCGWMDDFVHQIFELINCRCSYKRFVGRQIPLNIVGLFFITTKSVCVTYSEFGFFFLLLKTKGNCSMHVIERIFTANCKIILICS